MARKQTLTVTLPDGTVATRTTAANYTHVVVVEVTREYAIADAKKKIGWLKADERAAAAIMAEAEAAPEVHVGVLSWASRRDLAEKAVKGQAAKLYPGCKAYVLPVD